MKHIHHIVPKHIGGTDDPANLIELSVEDHAEAHRILYEKYGREEDKMAWLGLSGQATKKEVCSIGNKLGRKNADEVLKQKYGENWRQILAKRASKRGNEVIKEKMTSDPVFAEKIRINAKNARTKALTQEANEKRKATMKISNHSKGSKNSQYGTIWITNGKENKKIKKDIDIIPEGWYNGRIRKRAL